MDKIIVPNPPAAGTGEDRPVALLMDERSDSIGVLGEKLVAEGYDLVAGNSLDLLSFLDGGQYRRVAVLMISTTLPVSNPDFSPPSAASHEGNGRAGTCEETVTARDLEENLRRFFPMVPAVLIGQGFEELLADRAQGICVLGRLGRPVDPKAAGAVLEDCRGAWRSFQQAVQRRIYRDRMDYIEEPVARVLHDLNNQITGLKGGVDLIAYSLKSISDADTRQKFQRYIEKFIQPSLEQIEKMILLWRRLRESRLSPDDVCDLVQVVSGAVSLCASPARMSALEFVVDGEKVSFLETFYRSPASVPVKGKAERLVEAAANVLQNALEATEGQENGRVRITLNGPDPDGKCRLGIYDNGDGIPDETLPDIWRSFFTTKEGNRTGLGLSIAKQIVDKQNGRIDCVPSALGGAGFEISLPSAERKNTPVETGVTIGNEEKAL